MSSAEVPLYLCLPSHYFRLMCDQSGLETFCVFALAGAFESRPHRTAFRVTATTKKSHPKYSLKILRGWVPAALKHWWDIKQQWTGFIQMSKNSNLDWALQLTRQSLQKCLELDADWSAELSIFEIYCFCSVNTSFTVKTSDSLNLVGWCMVL